MRVDLSKFDPTRNFDRGASSVKFALWILVKRIFLQSSFPWPSAWKSFVLRLFGAKIGAGAVIKPRVNIHFPWRLEIGDHCWIGEEAFILNFERITVGSHCCISQRVFLCSGNHDYGDTHLAYRHAPITIADGVWVGAQSFVAPGAILCEECVVTAGSVAVGELPAAMVCSGNPATPKKNRWE